MKKNHIQEGLTTEQATELLVKHGFNELPASRSASVFSFFIRQFKSPFIYVLLVAAVVSLFLDHQVNSLFIFIVLMLNAGIGTVQEYSAEKAAAALEHLVPRKAEVIRDGKTIEIDARELVPGDLVKLSSGNRVPADIKLVDAQDLKVDESMLTGESVPVHKKPVPSIDDYSHNHCFAGTIVSHGRGQGEVVATGLDTEIGKIAEEVISDVSAVPPLMQRIHQFTQRITIAIGVLVVLILLVSIARGESLTEVFFFAVALAVSAIPEGLPAAITIALAIGMHRMAKKGVIIRKLTAVESLGSCTYIASDKTGTLTVNEMTIKKIVLKNGHKFNVSGNGFEKKGNVIGERNSEDEELINLLGAAGTYANESRIESIGEEWMIYGDQVDGAFLILANKLEPDAEIVYSAESLARIPYESDKGFSASINEHDGKPELFIKGSTEKLLEMTGGRVAKNIKQLFDEQTALLAAEGFRVIAVGVKKLDDIPENIEECLKDIELIALCGIIDPLREDAKEAIRQCTEASIEVAMVTGDHPDTALAIARELNMASDSSQTVTGVQLLEHKSSESECDSLIDNSHVFSRVQPLQKKDIVDRLIRRGEFVAVTGDGVNDAPALKHAHVGVAMGLRGTDVARESADIILTDDRFSSIVEGIKQGRIVYNNIRKVIFLLISTGAAEIVLILLSLIFATPIPLLPVQLLWLNLVTNGIQDIALAFEPEEGDELKRAPRKPDEAIFNRLMLERVLLNALVMGVIAFLLFYLQIINGVATDEARNVTLLLMVLFENVHVLNSRSETTSIFRQNLFGNKFLLFGMLAAQTVHILSMYTPGLKDVLEVKPVSVELWLKMLVVALLLVVVNEVYKLTLKSRKLQA